MSMITVDGNEAVASVAHRLNEVVVLYPITPSSPMGEHADDWSAQGKTNIFGTVPQISEMQSEAGAAGAVHGSLQVGALTTTFTASQGLLLMIPNMYKIAGELTPFVMHVAARSVATHALSIFGDHSDVMACRQTGFAMMCSGSAQEAHDFAVITQAATLKSRIPFLHFFDGFRTSHEIDKIEALSDEALKSMIDMELVTAMRARGMSPDNPDVRGTAQNPDVFFQAREACNTFYDKCPGIVADAMKAFAEITGREYGLVDYIGAPDAEKVIVIMGSGAEAAHETVDYLTAQGEKVGIVKVRLYRPFPATDFVAALPSSVKTIAVLDRTKEPGSIGEPLYLDIVAALNECAPERKISVLGGRYGLSSKEFAPAHVKAVFDEMEKASPKRHFTVGIVDDVTHLSLDVDKAFDIEPSSVTRAVFYGLGSDGTVGANKNSIKIIAGEPDYYGQGYFVYDSKKSGAMTVSHLRFSPDPIRSSYLIRKANFVACHQFSFLDRYDMLSIAAEGSVFLLNAPFGPDMIWDKLPREVQETIIDKNLKFYVINAGEIAGEIGMGRRINTIMQACFFAISGVMEQDKAIAKIKAAIEKTYRKKGERVVADNIKAVEAATGHLHEVKIPAQITATHARSNIVPAFAPEFVKKITSVILEGKGDLLPVSAFSPDGVWPSGTAQFEKRNIAADIPVWDPEMCIQCNKCVEVCPHSAIRVKVSDEKTLENAPSSFKHTNYRGREFENATFTIQVSPEDCTGCTLCSEVCPGRDRNNPDRKALAMRPARDLHEQEKENYDFFRKLPDVDRTKVGATPKQVQLFQPLFEFSGACSACGETPYIKLMTQLFGDRTIIANATGCSSIYGGNLPTTPYTKNADGRGPAWANSLFEDNAEFGFGMRLAVSFKQQQVREMVKNMADKIGPELAAALLEAEQVNEADYKAQRERVDVLKAKMRQIGGAEAVLLEQFADYLVRKSVWIVGGDGWAYDIGFGGLDHVIGQGQNVNILVLDTEAYSNTGGQQSKATPMGASAKFASAGRSMPKKDLGMIAMSYENVYVASVALGAKDTQTVKAFMEAESYDGPSIIIAYSHCSAHGYDISHGMEHQKLAVASGHWPLYRYDPRRAALGKPPLQLDSAEPVIPLSEYMATETRFETVRRSNPERYQMLLAASEQNVKLRYRFYKYLSGFGKTE